jgi:hypothetical protein
LFGGARDTYVHAVNAIRVFDAATETISTLSAKLPNVASFMASAAIGDNVYLFGGKINNFVDNSAYDTIVTFDINSRTISTSDLKLPTPLRDATAEAVGTTIYIFGGYIGGNVWIDTIQKYGYALPLANKSVGIVADIKEFYKGNAYNSGEPIEAYIYKNGEWTLIEDTPEDSPSGMELNIAYGDTPPEDTSKLWVKANKANKVIINDTLVWENGNRPNDIVAYPWSYSGITGEGLCYSDGVLYEVQDSSSVEKYYLSENKTELITIDSTQKFYKAVIGVVGTKVYIFGGSTTTSSDKITARGFVVDTETKLASELGIKYKVAETGSVVEGTKIHIFGGRTSSYSDDHLNKHFIYDSVSDTYSYAASFDEKVNRVSCVLADKSIYVRTNTAFYRYDIDNNRMTKLFAYDKKTYDRALAYFDNKIYMLLGSTNSNYATDAYAVKNVEYYDIATGKNVKCLDNTEVFDLAPYAFVYNDKILVNIKQSLYEFQYQIGNPTLESGAIQMIRASGKNTFPLFNSEELYVETDVETVYVGNENNEAIATEALLYKDGEWQSI